MSAGEKEPVGRALGAVGGALSVEGPGVEDMLSGVWDENQRSISMGLYATANNGDRLSSWLMSQNTRTDNNGNNGRIVASLFVFVTTITPDVCTPTIMAKH